MTGKQDGVSRNSSLSPKRTSWICLGTYRWALEVSFCSLVSCLYGEGRCFKEVNKLHDRWRHQFLRRHYSIYNVGDTLLSLAPRLLQRLTTSGHGITDRVVELKQPPHCDIEPHPPISHFHLRKQRPTEASMPVSLIEESKPRLAQVGSSSILFGDVLRCCLDIGQLGTCLFLSLISTRQIRTRAECRER